MEPEPPQAVEVVDPEVRSYIYSLVTALGGSASNETGRYVLGDDALGCLRDLKKWLRFYDEKLNRMDVARCLAETNLLRRDLLPILSLWGDSEQSDKHRSRIMLACLELLVPLTWPVEPHIEMTVNHHRHTPYLQYSQVLYKRGILGCTDTSMLRTVIRIALPSMTTPRADRSSRDEGILRLMLYFFRNLAVIGAPPKLATESDEDAVTRSATINAFHSQDVFALLLTMCSNMGDDFTFQDVIILEILFHLVKGVDVKQLFKSEAQCSQARTDQLEDVLEKELNLNREQAKNAPTRHGRFGTMIWVKRDDEKVSTVSGQDILKDDRATFLKMDKTKKWNKPRAKREAFDSSSNNFNMKTPLTSSARKNLGTFVEEFLDSGFNPLLAHVRKAIEREAERVTEYTPRHFFFVTSWFLEAERVRRDHRKEAHNRSKGTSREIEPDNFSLVASVLNQETFVSLNRYMQNSYDHKDWKDLTAGMRGFTQILLTVREMAQSPLEEDQDIAENIQSRIFYEETTHDRILAILRGYKDQGFWYLDACTELAHVFLRMLEQYSKQNADMQIRSKRRARRKKAAEKSGGTNDAAEGEDNESEEEDVREANKAAVERSFDLKRFSAKFCTQKSVDTFVSLATFYRELTSEQLKRAHRFFYRVAFKQEMSVLLFRVDIISLFYKMIKGPQGLDPSQPGYREWEELVRQVLKLLVRKLEKRPELITEMLFSKINSTVFYLEYGHEKQTLSSESKPAAALEVKPSVATTMDEKLRVVVMALLVEGKEELVKWLCQVLGSAADERQSWEMEAEARASSSNDEQPEVPAKSSTPVVPSDDACRTAMFKNGRLRLLMALSGLDVLGEDVPGAAWIIPLSIKASTLKETKQQIEKYCESPVEEIDGMDPRDLLRRKRTADPVASNEDPTLDVDFGSESEGDEDVDLDAGLFPANIRSKSNALKALKQKRNRRRQDKGDKDEKLLEAQRNARDLNALARQRKIKSDLYVHASDEESDEEGDDAFFAREEERRQTQARRIREALASGKLNESGPGKEKKAAARKRKAKRAPAYDNDDSNEDSDSHRKRQRSDTASPSASDDEDDLMTDDASTSPQKGTRSHTPPTSADFGLDFESPSKLFQWSGNLETGAPTIEGDTGNKEGGVGDIDEDPDFPPTNNSSRRQRVMAGFVIESDSE